MKVFKFQFTFERPENCSKSRLVQVPVREINNKHIKSIGEVGQKIREEEIKRQSTKKLPETVEETESKKETPVEVSKSTEVRPDESEPEIVDTKKITKSENPQSKETVVLDEPDIKFTKPTSSLDLERDWRSMSSTRQKANYLRFINDAELIARCFTAQLPKYIVDICK